MTRIGSYHFQQSALLNLQRARTREADAAEAVSSGRKASDLKGFGHEAESVTALKTVQSRVVSWQAQGEALAGKLEVQDAYLVETLDASTEAREGIQEALAMGRGDGLVSRITAAFQKAAGALNAKHEGNYLFAGARLDDRPFAADSLSDLTAAPAVADLFNNDTLKSATRLDDGVVIRTGEVASEIGGPLMEQFRRFQAFLEGPDGNFSTNLTDAQRTFLTTELPGFTAVESGLTMTAARNGTAQNQVDQALASLDDRAVSLKGLIGDRTEVDLAAAVAELNAAQTAVEATAKVFTSLKASSLLELLR